ncbi:hypothetical protein ACFOQM_07405, partial [Paenibacillus sp. GCM10012307]
VNMAAPIAPMAAPVVNMAAPIAPMAAPEVNMPSPVTNKAKGPATLTAQVNAESLAKAITGAVHNLGITGITPKETAAQPGGFSAAPLDIPAGKVTPTAPAAQASNTSSSITIGDIHIQATEGMDGEQLYEEFISKLYQQAKGAASILTGGNKSALLNG